MKRYQSIGIIAGVLMAGVALGVWARDAFLRGRQMPVKITSETTKTPSCAPMRAPDGSVTEVCPVEIIPGSFPSGVLHLPSLGRVDPLLVSTGIGTTTLKKETPFNDILIAESGSPYVGLRNARYTMWPYPGESPFKEVYLRLPDSYELLFPGYSNKQFVEFGDTKNIILYLRHTSSAGVGADARIIVNTPTATNDKDHLLGSFDMADLWEGFSFVSKGQEVVVEIVLSPSLDASPEMKNIIRTELARAVLEMEIIW